VAINASWGGGGNDVFLRDAINRAGTAGIIFCAAAGNAQSMQLPPAPQIIVQPRTLEDEVPIAVR